MDNLDKLKDIKPIQTITIDFTFYFIIISLIIIIFAIVIYFLTRNKNKKLTKAQIARKYLKNFDFKSLSDKQIAYDFTRYGYDCLQEQYKDEFLKIINQLKPFKYKKIVGKIDDDLIDQMKDYIRIRV
jgi:hypothetical protein